MHAYDEIYVARAQTNLGQMFRFAEEDLGKEVDDFFELFLLSGVADLFGKGDYRLISGMSGVEIAYEVMWRIDGEFLRVEPSWHFEKSQTYWAGWVLGWYQWYSGQSFRRIREYMPVREIREMYHPFHEMDLLQFADAAQERMRRRNMMTRLRIFRERLGMSQGELARRSGVSVRMIQHYEQRRKNINHAQVQTVADLAGALHCRIEDLMEIPEVMEAMEK